MEVGLLPFKKSPESEKFSPEKLFSIIEAANTIYDPSKKVLEDGEVQGRTHENLDSVLRTVGSECIMYRENVQLARRNIETGIAEIGGAVGAVIGVFSGNPELTVAGLSSVLTGGIADRLMKRTHGKNVFEKSATGAIQGKKKIEMDLTGLGLDKGYVHKNFRQIVSAFVMREREARDEDEAREQRERLGLTEEQIESPVFEGKGESHNSTSLQKLLTRQKSIVLSSPNEANSSKK